MRTQATAMHHLTRVEHVAPFLELICNRFLFIRQLEVGEMLLTQVCLLSSIDVHPLHQE